MNSKILIFLLSIAALGISQSTFSSAPSIVSITPASGSTGFVLGDHITILFDQPIMCGNQSVFYIMLDNAVIENQITDVMINGKVLTLTPEFGDSLTLQSQFGEALTYRVHIPKGAVTSLDDIPFGGYYDYTFTTADVSEPVLKYTVPTDNGEIDKKGALQFVFNKPVMLSSNWTSSITCGEDTITIPETLPVVISTIISIPFDLESYSFCSVMIAENSIEDLNGNLYTDMISLNFNTKDSEKPTIAMDLFPIADDSAASRMTSIILTLDDSTAVSVAMDINGGITVTSKSVTSLFTPDKLSIVNDRVTLTCASRFEAGEVVSVDVPQGLFKDAYNNRNDRVQFTFTVTDAASVPSVQSLDSEFAFEDGTVSIVFSDAVIVGNGEVTLECVNCEAKNTFTASAFSTNGKVLTVALSGLEANEVYRVTVGADAVFNLVGNGNTMTVLPQTVSIQTSARPVVLVEQSTPAQNAVSVAVNSIARIVLNEAVTRKAQCVLQAVSEAHNVTLEAISNDYAVVHEFVMNGLLPHTAYTIVIPANCFSNALNVNNAEATLAFTSTYVSAPTLTLFNLESSENVALDMPITLVFDQEISIANDAAILVKPRSKLAMQRVIQQVDAHTVVASNNAVANRLSANTEYTVYIPENTICNVDGLCMGVTTLLPFTTVAAPATRVLLQSTSPAAGATQVAVDAEVVLTFSQEVRIASGLAVNDAVADTILLENNEVQGVATVQGKEVHITFPLQSGKTYVYQYKPALFSTLQGAAVYYDLGSSFSFTVVDTEGPVHYLFSVNNMQTATIRFNEPVLKGDGMLVVKNTAGETVYGPVAATNEAASSAVMMTLNKSDLPDDFYTFEFAANFVKDVYGNPSAAFSEVYTLDRVPPALVEVSQPTTPLASAALVMNEVVTLGECTITLQDSTTSGIKQIASSNLEVSGNRVMIAPVNGKWSSLATITVTIPATCVMDLRSVHMVSNLVATISTPEVGVLALDSATPANNAESVTVASVYGNEINLMFGSAIAVDSAKTMQLRTASGCVLTGVNSIAVDDTHVSFSDFNMECLKGTIYLVAEAGAISSTVTGAESPASTVASPLYSFSFTAVEIAPVSANAVYHNGLQIVAGSSIAITFNEAISASAAALQSLSFLEFIDSEGSVVSFAEHTHGVIEDKTLSVVVDQAFEHALPNQIRSIRFIPVEPTQGVVSATAVQKDVFIGTVVMTRLFAIPSARSHISAMLDDGLLPLQPTLVISFDQNVLATSSQCQALIITDAASTMSIPVSQLVVEDSKKFSYTPSASELLKPTTTYSFIVDNSCFFVTATNSAASGSSEPFTATTGADVYGPMLVGAKNVNDNQSSSDISLSVGQAFLLLFNEPVVLTNSGYVYFHDTEDNTEVQLPLEYLAQDSNPNAIRVTWDKMLFRSTGVYTVRVVGIVRDLAENDMAASSLLITVRMPVLNPNPVTNINAEMVQSGSLMVSFNAAVDTNLPSSISLKNYCHYTIIVYPSQTYTQFDDVCVGDSYESTVRLGTTINGVDPAVSHLILVSVRNGLTTAADSTAQFTLLPAENIAPATPSMPQLLLISAMQSEGRRLEEEVMNEMTLHMDSVSSASTIVSYTFSLLMDGEYSTVTVLADPTSQDYTVSYPASVSELTVSVKANTQDSSSAFSEPLVITNANVVSAAPSTVNVNTISYQHLSSSSVEVTWTAPESRELITSYVITSADQSRTFTTTSTSVVLDGLVSGNNVFTIVAVTQAGSSEAVSFTVENSGRIQGSVIGVTAGSTFAVATIRSNFLDSAVECVLNAGKVVYAEATVGSTGTATVLFSGLLNKFHYSGLCWVYSASASEVSDAISLTFTTANPEKDRATLSVERAVVLSANDAVVSVSIDIPATIACAAVPVEQKMIHGDVMQYGQKVESVLDGAHEIHFTSLPTNSLHIYCAAENMQGDLVGSLYESETMLVPLVSSSLTLEEQNIQSGATDVSVHPTFVWRFSNAVRVAESGEMTLENVATHATISLPMSLFSVEKDTLTFSIPQYLEHATSYSLYSNEDCLIVKQDSDACFDRIMQGQFVFTTTASDNALTVSMVDSEVEPSGSISIQLSTNAVFNAVDLTLSHNEVEVLIPAADVMVHEATAEILFYGLVANTPYELEVPACAFEDELGNCNEATLLAFSTISDDVRPVVISSEPASAHETIPNDVPIRLFFNERVYLNNVRNIIITTNGQRVTLNAMDVAIEKNRVDISLPRGYSRGNHNLPFIQVVVEVREAAFKDAAGNKSEYYKFDFTAVAERCGSSYLSKYMEDDCSCYNENGRCYCDCGLVNLFEL